MPTAIVEGATSAFGAVTGRHYRIAAGETRKIEAPEGEFSGFPDNRVQILSERRYENSGSWKELYENGDKVDSVQCTKDEAEAWANGDLDLSDLQD